MQLERIHYLIQTTYVCHMDPQKFLILARQFCEVSLHARKLRILGGYIGFVLAKHLRRERHLVHVMTIRRQPLNVTMWITNFETQMIAMKGQISSEHEVQ